MRGGIFNKLTFSSRRSIFLRKRTHFSFQTGPLIDELLRFFSEVGIRFFKGAEVIIRIVGQITIGAFYIRTHVYQFNQKPTVYKVCVVWACIVDGQQRVQRARDQEFISMGECELCGAVKVGVKRVPTGKTEVAACAAVLKK